MRRWSSSAALLGALVLPACAPAESPDDQQLRWLSGTTDERFAALEDQLGGFSQAMWEVGLRYADLYWAVEDGNWELAEYQAEKIEAAIERGVIRRPDREDSARRLFLDGPLPSFREAVASGEADRISGELDELIAACNACHVAEDLGFIRIEPPSERATVFGPLNRDP